MANKFYTVKKEIGGVVYTAQFNGVSAAMAAIDNCYIDGTTNTSLVKLADYILSNVIVDPKGLTPDDFPNVAAFQEVLGWGREVMDGGFRPEEDEGGAAKKGS